MGSRATACIAELKDSYVTIAELRQLVAVLDSDGQKVAPQSKSVAQRSVVVLIVHCMQMRLLSKK